MKYILTNAWQQIDLESGETTSVQNRSNNVIRIFIDNTIPSDDTERRGFVLENNDVLRFIHDGRNIYGICQYGNAFVETL